MDKKLLNFGIIYVVLMSVAIAILLYFNISLDIINYQTEYNFQEGILVFIVYIPVILLLIFNRDFRSQARHKKLLIVGVTFLIVSTNFNSHFNFFFSIVWGVSAFINFIVEKKFYKPNKLHFLFFTYLIVNALSLLWSKNTDKGSAMITVTLMPFLFIPLGFMLFKLDKKQFDIILLVVFRSMMIFLFLSICTWILQSNAFFIPLSKYFILQKHNFGIHKPFDIVYAWTNFHHPTYLGIEFVWGLAIAWLYIVKNKLSKIELFTYIFATLFIAVITQSRFIAVVWVLVNIFGLLLFFKENRRYQIIFSAVVVLLLVISFSFMNLKKFFSDDVREAHYKAAFISIKENPILGTGVGGMTTYINANNPAYFKIDRSDFTHESPHNQIIGDMMQTGILGLISILAIIFYTFYIGFKYRNWLLLSFFSLYSIFMFIEMPLISTKATFCFVVITCFLVNVYNKYGDQDGIKLFNNNKN